MIKLSPFANSNSVCDMVKVHVIVNCSYIYFCLIYFCTHLQIHLTSFLYCLLTYVSLTFIVLVNHLKIFEFYCYIYSLSNHFLLFLCKSFLYSTLIYCNCSYNTNCFGNIVTQSRVKSTFICNLH